MKTVPALPQHVDGLLYRMPREQRDRLLKLHGARVANVIRDNIRKSDPTWCGLDDDGVVNLGGVLPDGYAWQFITPAVRAHKRDYVTQSRAMMAEALRRHARVVTVIEAEYPAALRHARRSGFQVGPVQDVNGIPACICERTR